MSLLGCDKLSVATKLTYKNNQRATSVTIGATFSEEFPNLPPALQWRDGSPGFDEMEIGVELPLLPVELIEPDADIVVLTFETTGLVRFSDLRAPPRTNKKMFMAPEYEPQFMAGDVNVSSSRIQVRCTLAQAHRALYSLYLKTESLDLHNLTISVDDEGRTGIVTNTHTRTSAHTPTHAYKHAHSHTHTHAFSLSLSRFLSLTHTHTDKHTHTSTHSNIHMHTRTRSTHHFPRTPHTSTLTITQTLSLPLSPSPEHTWE